MALGRDVATCRCRGNCCRLTGNTCTPSTLPPTALKGTAKTDFTENTLVRLFWLRLLKL